jgi:enhanced filamentous growth protein 1
MDSVDSNRPPQSAGATPSLHHHHSMQGSVGGQAPPTPHSIAPHPNAGRPGIDRAHTFPTPPTSASSVLGMGNQGSSYEWGGQNLPNGVNGSQSLSIDTGINARSMPTTPATTPPSNTQQGMQGYPPGQPGYDKNIYNNTPGSQGGYPPHPDSARYGQPTPYKSEMGPPSAPGSGPIDAHDPNHSQGHEGEHAENGYPHPNSAAYSANQGQYAYPGTAHPHLSPEMTGSPHQSGSGRGTPRTMPSAQPQWSTDYQTPPRAGTSSNVYSVMGTTSSSAGPSSAGNYASSAYSANGPMPSKKRGREEDDQDRPGSRDYDYAAKRQNTGTRDTFGLPLGASHLQAIKTGGHQ